MTERKRSLAERVASGEGAVSIINEPIDYTIDYTVRVESALDRARQRWQHAELMSSEDHE